MACQTPEMNTLMILNDATNRNEQASIDMNARTKNVITSRDYCGFCLKCKTTRYCSLVSYGILREWINLDAAYMQNLEYSLPNRVQEVIKAKGGVKRY
ncbi:hypothetical protein C0J52_13893 [Blattella germanica]|nr:hypothetical protein C0J52_13893 [Blattella germanica]